LSVSFFGDLPVEPRNAVTQAVRSSRVPLLESEQCELPRAHQISISMLVMNGQRLDRTLPEVGERTAPPQRLRFGQREEIPPEGRGLRS
jgi:hypothetical protein